MRVGGRLTFPLCRSCVREEMKKPLLEQSNMWSFEGRENAERDLAYPGDPESGGEKA